VEQDVEMKSSPGLTYAHCREVALGRMMYSPTHFGTMMAGDFLDALIGYSKGENERTKSLAELFRVQTTILWNIQVDNNHKLSPQKLWPFPWEEVQITDEEITQEMADQNLKQLIEALNNKDNGGNSTNIS
jgi:hypothetical protein